MRGQWEYENDLQICIKVGKTKLGNALFVVSCFIIAFVYDTVKIPKKVRDLAVTYKHNYSLFVNYYE